MIDLRKPLEGVPGLLLMAALIFFGAAIGIGVALAFTWIPMSDALANFLGGVVGAGLGAALAVMGAVYVQRKDRRDSAAGDINLIVSRMNELSASLVILNAISDPARDDGSETLRQLRQGHPIILGSIEEALVGLPEGANLSAPIHHDLVFLKKFMRSVVAVSRLFFPEALAQPVTVENSKDYRNLLGEAKETIERVRGTVQAL